MPRARRLMVADWPFHVTHRGNRQETIFQDDGDRHAYLDLLSRFAAQFEMNIWAYCLMPNHVHLIAVGRRRSSISRAVGTAHQVFSRRRNVNRDTTGHWWANRFFSTAVDEPHLWAAVRYVELNPVRARMVRSAVDYPWSSARAHAGLAPRLILDPGSPFPGPISGWESWLGAGLEEQTERKLRENTACGRPTGSELFAAEIKSRQDARVRPSPVSTIG
jgi:putative transposase